MPSQRKLRKLSIEQILLLVVWLSEFVGLYETWNIPWVWIGFLFSWIHLPINIRFSFPLIVQVAFLFLWCLIQVLVSTFLVIQTFNRFRYRDKHAGRFANMAMVCVIIQIFGFLQSMQIFGAAVALTNGLFLYQLSDD